MRLTKQKGFIDGRELGELVFKSILKFGLVCAVGGWALIEGAIWLWQHVSFALK